MIVSPTIYHIIHFLSQVVVNVTELTEKTQWKTLLEFVRCKFSDPLVFTFKYISPFSNIPKIPKTQPNFYYCILAIQQKHKFTVIHFEGESLVCQRETSCETGFLVKPQESCVVTAQSQLTWGWISIFIVFPNKPGVSTLTGTQNTHCASK